MSAPYFARGRTARSAVLLAGLGALAAAPAAGAKPANAYRQTNLVADRAGQHARLVDHDLVNPWGLAIGPSTPIWSADNGSDNATLYSGGAGRSPVAKQGLIVTIPGGAPTGQVFNGTGAFGGALFIFSTEKGRIVAWTGGDAGVTMARRRGAIYKGLAMAGRRLYATDFHHGRVDVFNSAFHRVAGGFRDRRIPRSYAPFGIKALRGRIYVTYAKQDAKGEDDVSGPGRGFVDVYSRRGRLVKRLVRHGKLNSPWGLLVARRSFGRFAGDLLVGNFGDGRIDAYSPRTGRFRGRLRRPGGGLLTIPGLWDLTYGNAMFAGPRVVFSAGPDDESHGLLGTITPG